MGNLYSIIPLGDLDDETRVFLEADGLELPALRILERLSHLCGPFLVVEASAGHAVAVTPGCDPAVLADRL